MTAAQELHRLSILLDSNEYDDEDEYQEVLDEYYPEVVCDVAHQAALEGSINGMHLYGIMLANKAIEIKDQTKDYQHLIVEAREWVAKAAKQGCMGAMEDLASEQTELLDVPIELQLAFYKLVNADDDLEEYVAYLKDHCSYLITVEQRTKSIEIYNELVKTLEKNGVKEKKVCECIFP